VFGPLGDPKSRIRCSIRSEHSSKAPGLGEHLSPSRFCQPTPMRTPDPGTDFHREAESVRTPAGQSHCTLPPSPPRSVMGSPCAVGMSRYL
jgi:hypothetical protein